MEEICFLPFNFLSNPLQGGFCHGRLAVAVLQEVEGV